MVQTAKKSTLTRSRMLDFLGKLSATPGEEPLTLSIPPHLSPNELAEMIQEIHALPAVAAEISEICTRAATGAIIYWSSNQKSLVIPPFPIIEKIVSASLETAPLKSALEEKYLIGVVLIRLGSYAIGVCRGDKLVSSKVGTGLVHGRHRRGGSSAHRFERHRDKQIESFFIRVCGHAREQLEPYVKSMDYIAYGGAWRTIQLFVKYCPLLAKLDKPVLPPLLDIPEPRQPVLETAVNRIWSSTLYEWRED